MPMILSKRRGGAATIVILNDPARYDTIDMLRYPP